MALKSLGKVMESSKILVVPDVHGRPFWRKVIDSDLPVIFLGDYLDPYPYEGFTAEDAISNFKAVLEFARSQRNRVILLIGNHDAQQVGYSPSNCRMDTLHKYEIYGLFKDNENLFKFAHLVDNTLFTHAGVSKGWLEQNNIPEDVNKILELNKHIMFIDEYLDFGWNGPESYNLTICDIGRSRGGYAPNGSPIWADVQELIHDSAFKDNLIQIFGHSQMQTTGNFIHVNNIYMCDSRAVFEWNGEELKLF